MKNFLFCIFFVSILYSCNELSYRMNGIWQLRTITDKNGETENYDSIFYNFQKGHVFMLTVLKSANSSIRYYGYLDFYKDDIVEIMIDKKYQNEDFLKYSGWDSYIDTFSLKLSKNNLTMISFTNEKEYKLKKF